MFNYKSATPMNLSSCPREFRIQFQKKDSICLLSSSRSIPSLNYLCCNSTLYKRPTMQSVEITILSAQNLRVGKTPMKKSAFVTVRAESAGECCTTAAASAGEGGGNLTWNEKLAVDLQPADLRSGFITVEVHCKVTSSKNKLVGGVRVPVSDFLPGFLPGDNLQFLSYRLWDPTYERNGVINISVRVKSPEQLGRRCSHAMQVMQPVKAIGVPFREGYRKGLSGAVTGVPVVWFGRHYTH
ncbi:hypothetical protein SAY86_027238 [Trapa natans]|uniref:C2 domain-containing protein n=1 Tax=Trapa natans TaxID=22666 RepID=A0AAN7KQW7_TRANT|nr:hypothetical protein SAY86_027238 [Trapa natans]